MGARSVHPPDALDSLHPNRAEVGERYVVGSVTGWPITQRNIYNERTRIDTRQQPASVWYVYDSAWCYRIMAERRGRYAEQHAREIARRLNLPEDERHCGVWTLRGPCLLWKMPSGFCNTHDPVLLERRRQQKKRWWHKRRGQ